MHINYEMVCDVEVRQLTVSLYLTATNKAKTEQGLKAI